MIIDRFRADLLKLSTESMPTANADGTTCYEVDTGKFYIYYKSNWYLQGETDPQQEEQQEEQQDSKELKNSIEEKIEIPIEEPIEEKNNEEDKK